MQEFDRESPIQGAEIVHQTLRYPITIEVTDGALPEPAVSTCFLLVTIVDINDNAPQFELDSYREDIPLNPERGRIFQVYAFDIDEGHNADIVYSLENDAQCSNCFRIDEKGWIWLDQDITVSVLISITLVLIYNTVDE